MKITATPRKEAGKKYVRVGISEERRIFFKEDGAGVSTLVIGAGPKKEMTRRKFITLCRLIARTAREHKIERLAIDIDTLSFEGRGIDDGEELYSIIAQNLLIADYEFNTYKTKKTPGVAEVVLCGAALPAAKKGVDRGVTIATYVNACRDLANTPGGAMTPTILANDAKRLAKGTRVAVKVLDKKMIEKEKMGALLGVAKGSKEAPTFIILEYWGAGKPQRKQRGASKNAHDPIVFIGKGITFDTGGLNIKPGEGMLEMHLDMSGGAAVIAAVIAAAKLNLKKNVIGLVPAAENSVGNESFRPGDILTSLSGKTIDVLNTDAEGRLILADALTYATRYNPRLVIDVATLTGAALAALGQHASALMTKDSGVEKTLIALAEESGDYMWPLPLWDEFTQYTKGMHADLANIPWQGNTRAGGVINGGAFLSHFAVGYPWAHVDMAPRMTAAPGDRLARGATGEPVRFLLKVAESYE